MSVNTVPESKTKKVWPPKDVPLVKQKAIFEIEFEIETRGGTVSESGLRDIMQDICETKPPHFHALPKLTIKAMKQIDPPLCPRCKTSDFDHKHDTAHGITGAHMVNTERYECRLCRRVIGAVEGKPLGFKFVYD